MAEVITYKVNRDKSDRRLINFLYEEQLRHPEWLFERDDLKFSLKVGYVDIPFSLLIRSADETKLIAGIPENEPLKVMLFDASAYETMNTILEGFKPKRFKKPIFLEIQ